MNLTSKTIRRLQSLNMDQDTFNAVLEIFEQASAKKPKKGDAADRAARGTRLPDEWVLPKSWGDKAVSLGLKDWEVRREAEKFKNYWCGVAGPRGVKLEWSRTFTNWCISVLERAGRTVNFPGDDNAPSGAPMFTRFTDEAWQAVARQFKRTGRWNPQWGPEPGSRNCLMPSSFLSQNKVDNSGMGSML